MKVDRLLPADSPRSAGVDEEHVLRLAEFEGNLPPILVERLTMRVIDGMHRLRAAQLKGQQSIAVTFLECSEEEAFLRSVEENVSHGLPLSLTDRKAAARRILATRPELSDRSIAARTGLAARTVAAVRRCSGAEEEQLNSRFGTDGRRHPLSGTGGRLRAAEIIAARPEASLREIAREAGVSVGTAHDVRARLLRGEEPLPATQLSAGRPGAGKTGRAAPSAYAQSSPPTVRSRCQDGGEQYAAILRNLTKDPSLRHTESGRELLRWLHAQLVLDDDWRPRVESVPAHCSDAVAELARQCAEAWQQIARQLSDRDR
nr:ParB/RepB/Spo0J family partition protein [Streptomyces inusitatus]